MKSVVSARIHLRHVARIAYRMNNAGLNPKTMSHCIRTAVAFFIRDVPEMTHDEAIEYLQGLGLIEGLNETMKTETIYALEESVPNYTEPSRADLFEDILEEGGGEKDGEVEQDVGD